MIPPYWFFLWGLVKNRNALFPTFFQLWPQNESNLFQSKMAQRSPPPTDPGKNYYPIFFPLDPEVSDGRTQTWVGNVTQTQIKWKNTIQIVQSVWWQSELHICSSRNVCIDTQGVSIVLVYWAPVYRHIWHRLLHIQVCRQIHSTTLHTANIYCNIHAHIVITWNVAWKKSQQQGHSNSR